jgi:hypothetical protein
MHIEGEKFAKGTQMQRLPQGNSRWFTVDGGDEFKISNPTFPSPGPGV